MNLDAKKTANNSLALLVIIAFVILLPPLMKAFKGVGSIVGAAGDVLSFPARIWDALNRQTDKAIEDMLYDAADNISRKTTYNENDPEHRKLMEVIKLSGWKDKKTIINRWKLKGAGKLGNIAAQSLFYKQIADKIRKELNKLF